ncbi:hypothetical protein NDU88_001974 [Pleurodeles waltl]|uniref:Uncharacterized protein n=1 Tax=Pleurodeles waltl TaxID=8319 RepID=A0AAV7U8I3_PLEWA|nr:hypothetical protein NDU88_001974 [Pleurodeles waltl]
MSTRPRLPLSDSTEACSQGSNAARGYQIFFFRISAYLADYYILLWPDGPGGSNTGEQNRGVKRTRYTLFLLDRRGHSLLLLRCCVGSLRLETTTLVAK